MRGNQHRSKTFLTATLVNEMKLRFRSNTLRLRVNRREVEALASGEPVRENVFFPGNIIFTYTFEPDSNASPRATFDGNAIRVGAPIAAVRDWARSDTVGLYFDIPASSKTLKIAIEKDLECIDGAPGEQDPEAFPRYPEKTC